MAAKDWPEERVWHDMLDTANFGGRFVQNLHQRNPSRARNWFARQYDNCVRFVREHPSQDLQGNAFELGVLRSKVETLSGFSRGQAGVTERALMRAFLDKADLRGSPIVRFSTRDLVADIDSNVATVTAGLRRLKAAGWISVYKPASGRQATTYRLKTGKTDTGSSSLLGGKDTPVVVLPARVSALFGSQGLGRSVAETLAVVPHDVLRLPRGRLVRVNRSLPVSTKRVDGLKGLPTSLLDGAALTAQEVRAALGGDATAPSIETVRRHLRRAEQVGADYKLPDGRWQQFYFDPPGLAEHWQMPDSPALKRERARLERINFLEFLTTKKGRATRPSSVVKRLEADMVIYEEVDQQGVVREVGRRDARSDERQHRLAQ